MTKSQKSLLFILLVAIVLGFVSYNQSHTPDDTKITIGVTPTLTGFTSSWGEHIKGGVDLAISEINAAGGIDGQPISIIYEDIGQIDLRKSASAAQKLSAIDKVNLIITQWTPDNDVIAPIAANYNIPVINIASASKNTPKNSPPIFMLTPSDDMVTSEIVDYAHARGITNPVMLVSQNSYHEGLSAVTGELWKSKTGSDIAKVSVLDSETDYRTVITNIKDKKYDAIFVYVINDKFSIALKTLSDFSVNIPKFGYIGILSDHSTLAAAGLAAEGVIYPDFQPNKRDFIEKYKAVIGRDPGINSDLAYDAIYVIADAVKEEGSSSEGIVKGLRSIKNFKGVSGSISFDKSGQRLGALVDLKVIRNGVSVVLE